MSIRFNGVTRVAGALDPNSPQSFNLDPLAGGTYRDKPILDLNGAISHLVTGETIHASNGVITYTFLDLKTLTNLYNNPTLGFTAGVGLSPYTSDQRAAARAAIQLWDDLIPQTFKEVKGMGADIVYANSEDPAQAYAYYPGKQGWKFQSDVFTHDPATNWTNAWFTYGGYGNTTLVHETGHSLGLSHPGNYNYSDDEDGDGQPDPITYANDAEYAQDSTQYTIMSYFSASETGARIVNWNEFLYSNAQTPLLHDIAAIQSQYGADPTTRSGDTTYGFHSTAGNAVYDFTKNPYPYLSVYDAGGNDTIDLSGFTVGQFLDLHAGSFSSIGAGAPTEATVNAALANLTHLSGEDWGSLDQATINAIVNSYRVANGNSIAADTGVTGIYASEYSNFSIAYGVTIENATGGSARDLLWGNQVANVLSGMGGNDVIQGFEGNDTLIGGAGSDTFVYAQADTNGTDTISDFATGVDKIDLQALDVTASNVTYNATTHQVEIDLNHDGTADMFINSANAVGSGDYIFHA
jgi:serralysin